MLDKYFLQNVEKVFKLRGIPMNWIYEALALRIASLRGPFEADNLRGFLTEKALEAFLTTLAHSGLLAMVLYEGRLHYKRLPTLPITSDESVEQSAVDGIEITLEFSDDATDEEMLSASRKAVELANEIHFSMGGHGLQLERIEGQEVNTLVEA